MRVTLLPAGAGQRRVAPGQGTGRAAGRGAAGVVTLGPFFAFHARFHAPNKEQRT